MKLVLVYLAVLPLVASATRISFQRIPSNNKRPATAHSKRSSIFHSQSLASSGDGSVDLSNVHDLLYMANVTIGGTDYPLQLDSGSSDLVMLTKVSNAQSSTITLNMTYGVGYAYGNVANASVAFADLSVANQAFLDSTSADNPITAFGAVGIMGLGFTTLSNIDATVQNNQNGATWGRNFLYNAFAQSPSEPNFITFSLARSQDGTTSDEGGFTIGEIDPEFSSVQSTEAISTWPVSNPYRWNIVVDAYETLSGKSTFNSSVKGISQGQAVLLLDTGTSYVYAPEDIVTKMYGNIAGAKYDSSAGQWDVPCDAQAYLGFWIGTRRFDLHPLDLVVPSLSDSSSCVGSFIPQTLSVGGGEFDILAGDVFLRNVFTVFDFGDFTDSSNLTMGNPYVKLLSTTNVTSASEEFNKVRGGNTTLPISNSGGTGTTSTPSSSTPSPTSSPSNLSIDELAKKVDHINSYEPALIAVLAANALIMLGLLAVCIVLLVRRRNQSPTVAAAGGGFFGGRGRRSQRRGAANTISTMELAPGKPEDGGPVYAPVSLQNPDLEAPRPVGSLYDTPAYRQSTVSWQTEPFRESAAL